MRALRSPAEFFRVSYHEVKLSPDELLAAINRQTSVETDQQLAAAIAADAGYDLVSSR
jgi:hypothetical protein